MAKKNNQSFMKPMAISSELSEFIGTGPVVVPDVKTKIRKS